MSIGLKNTTDFTYYVLMIDAGEDTMKDLGVIIDCKLKFHDHIKEKINKAYISFKWHRWILDIWES